MRAGRGTSRPGAGLRTRPGQYPLVTSTTDSIRSPATYRRRFSMPMAWRTSSPRLEFADTCGVMITSGSYQRGLSAGSAAIGSGCTTAPAAPHVDEERTRLHRREEPRVERARRRRRERRGVHNEVGLPRKLRQLVRQADVAHVVRTLPAAGARSRGGN